MLWGLPTLTSALVTALAPTGGAKPSRAVSITANARPAERRIRTGFLYMRAPPPGECPLAPPPPTALATGPEEHPTDDDQSSNDSVSQGSPIAARAPPLPPNATTSTRGQAGRSGL